MRIVHSNHYADDYLLIDLQVVGVKLRKDRIVVAQEQKVSVYNFADLKLLNSIETVENPNGLLALSSHPDHIVMACPGLHTGKV